MSAALSDGEETPDQILSVSSVPTNRRNSLSAWEDGTPLSLAAVRPVGWVIDPVDELAAAGDTADLLSTTTRTPAPTQARRSTAAAVVEPDALRGRRGVTLPSVPGRTAALAAAGVGAATVVGVALWLFGTAALPPLGALAAVVGLVVRSRAGAR